jgi:NADH dehydrogenase
MTQQTSRSDGHEATHRVVVIGTGFGGLFATRKLRKAPVDLTVIGNTSHHLFQPLLYQVATGVLSQGEIAPATREILRRQDNAKVLFGEVTAIDVTAQTVTSQTLVGETVTPYDSLIVAAGAGQSYFGNDHFAEFAPGMKSIDDALELRGRIFGAFEIAELLTDPAEIEEWLTFVVVGAGPTGVETAGAFAEFRNVDMPVTYPELDRSRIHISLVEAGPVALAPFKPKLQEYARKSLEKRGVDLRLNTMVKEVRPDGVLIERDGQQEFLETGIVVWAAGVTAHPTLLDWNVPQGRGGRIEVDEHQQVVGLDQTYAIGDVSIGPAGLPQLAQPALQGGKHVAKHIQANLKGREIKPFKYNDKGTMATIGKSSAVADITYMPDMTGFPAWIIWVVLHIATLLGNRNRLATMINLSSKYLFSGSHNAIVGETPYVVAKHRMQLTPHEREEQEQRILERRGGGFMQLGRSKTEDVELAAEMDE